MRRALAALVTLLCLSAVPACKDGGSAGKAKGEITIAVVPKGTTHEFWKAVHAGAAKAAKETGAKIVWKGPLKEDDLDQQIDVVQTFVAQGVSGIVLAPLNDKALVAPVKAAEEAKIPVLIFDSDLASTDRVSFVATDNFAAGKIAGDALAKLLGDAGKVLVLRYQEGSASTHQREEGFLAAVKAHPSIQIVSDKQYGGATTETAFSASENLLAANKAAEGGVTGVFCPNESTTFGMLLALEKAGLAGKTKFVGFDASEKLLNGLSSGKIDGLVVQNPFNMGYLAVTTMVKAKKGEKVEPRIDTGATLVTKDNLEKPEIKALLHPDLKTWLGE
ncbi:MAG TPA: substrate-binding domain-containing protein [Minicystis sp.]|nr:substrate-binding domain-containing protein [Minicystis sp.]